MKKNYTKSQIKKVSYLMIGSFVVIYALVSYFLVFHKLLNKKNLSNSSLLETKQLKQNNASPFLENHKSNGNLICHQQNCFDIQIAKTEEQKKIGLMGVSKLPIKSGMFFEFKESGKHPFWMKNTLIPLDIIRIDKDYKIVDIQTVQPCKNKEKTPKKGFFCPNYIPKADANFVLEINAGLSKTLGIKVGEKFILK